jgi:hypothetical protein
MNAVRTIEVPVSFTVPELYRATLSIQYGKTPIAKRILFLVSVAFLGGLIWKLLGASQNEVIAAYAFIVGWILFPAFLVGVIFVAPYIGTAARVKREPRLPGARRIPFLRKERRGQRIFRPVGNSVDRVPGDPGDEGLLFPLCTGLVGTRFAETLFFLEGRNGRVP